VRDDISDIAASYDRSVEDEDARLERHQLEYDLTWRYLTRYLPPVCSILEIGAGTGRYTLALCRRGYSVTAPICQRSYWSDASNGSLRNDCRDRCSLSWLTHETSMRCRPRHSTPFCSWGRCTI
jgi:SAM-dependent methyltransferase